MRCTAKTKAGRRCARPALRGREVCQAHSGERVGRPSALTPEVHARLVQAKQAGCPDWAAARSAGISESTYYELRRRGEAEESGPHRELREALERATGEAYLHAMASWRRDMGAPGNWRACVAYVDRVDRGRFGSGAGSSPGTAPRSQEERPDLSELSDAELEIFERRYEGEGSESE